MSTISGQYSPALYPLYQAGQGNSAVGQNNPQNGTQNTFSLEQVSNDSSNPANLQQTGNTQNSPNALTTLQASAANNAGTSAAQPPAAPDSDSDDNDPNTSFINNQEASADYQSMVLNLGQGNLAAAAKDYAQLQTDLKLHGQHHSGGTVSVDMNSSVESAAGSVLNVTV